MFFCSHCNDFTRSVEPVMVRYQDINQFHVRVLCANCYYTKAKYLSPSELQRLPPIFNTLPFRNNYMKYLKLDKSSKHITEIFPLIEPIINS